MGTERLCHDGAEITLQQDHQYQAEQAEQQPFRSRPRTNRNYNSGNPHSSNIPLTPHTERIFCSIQEEITRSLKLLRDKA